jgi:hypothetical protein
VQPQQTVKRSEAPQANGLNRSPATKGRGLNQHPIHNNHRQEQWGMCMLTHDLREKYIKRSQF